MDEVGSSVGSVVVVGSADELGAMDEVGCSVGEAEVVGAEDTVGAAVAVGCSEGAVVVVGAIEEVGASVGDFDALGASDAVALGGTNSLGASLGEEDGTTELVGLEVPAGGGPTDEGLIEDVGVAVGASDTVGDPDEAAEGLDNDDGAALGG